MSSGLVSQPGDGYLHLQVQTVAHPGCKSKSESETGSLVESNPLDGVSGHVGFAYSYGYVEWSVYLPGKEQKGCPKGGCIANWPAFWSLPEGHENGNHSSEIDTMEGLENGLACYAFHPPFPGNGACLSASYAGWHTFGADWEPSGVTYYYDGTNVAELQSAGNSPSPEYLVMNDIPSRTTAPKLYKHDVLIDYVRVWHRGDSSPAVVREEGSGTGRSMWVFYRGVDGALGVESWNGSEWVRATSFASYGAEVTEGSSPTVVREEGSGAGKNMWAFYREVFGG